MVVESEDGYGLAVVDDFGEFCSGEEVVEGAEFREMAEEPCDVEGGGSGGS